MRRELPFVYTGSAAASGAGLGLIFAPVAEAAPARRLAVFGSAIELTAARLIERRPGVVTQAWTTGRAHRLHRAGEVFTLGGAVAAGPWPGAAGPPPPRPAWPCSAAASCSASVPSRPASPPPRTRNTSWSRSATA